MKFLKSQYRIPIEINAKIAGHSINDGYIKRYKRERGTHEKDKTFLLYDLDVSGVLERIEAIRDTTLLVSNPCFELWYLLHFKAQKSDITCKACNDELDKRAVGYKKGQLGEKLKDKLTNDRGKAIKRAKALKKYQNPSSTVFLLIEELERARKGEM